MQAASVLAYHLPGLRLTNVIKSLIMKTGIELITEERKEQIEKHEYTIDHDSNHDLNTLALAATLCVMPRLLYSKDEYANSHVFSIPELPGWKLPLNWEGNALGSNRNLTKEKRIHQLKVAGALIAAEIDRLQDNS